ncbi:HlyD family efflux transporter periplasmic adaptor subunit [Rhizobium sp. XQZ8]|uniref:HlyD family efflux transporter periplasmic adaptor subunit n=1 Tax=Rhizobium populisoli TaxID=2859785 RepID=UPI001CA47FF8|nr:HlyD family efflux transporter periplasmic adaptor subunit [Rhizobium populisoli]MBW6424941.1 HlyD family efflux transporter periplasmic adaptor subunit [Rhizobium populisoli]
MKLVKIIVGLIIVLVAGYVVVGEQLTGASADAVINARLTTVRSSISGRLGLQDRPLGAQVRRNEQIGDVTDDLVDNVRAGDLENEKAQGAAEHTRLLKDLMSVQEAIVLLRERSRNYSADRIRQLEAQVAASQSLGDAAEAKLKSATLELQRTSSLANRGIETGVSYQRAQSLVEVSRLELANARAETVAASVSLEAARRGTFLGDGYNDAPYSEQRIAELELRQAELKSQVDAQAARLAAVDARLSAERLRVNRLGSATLQSNVNGLLWDVLAASGETVQRGEDVVRLVDCDSTIVTLSVSESVYNSLTVGGSAQFRLNGRTEVMSGTVTRLAGAGAETIYKNLAIAPSRRHLERYDVTVTVPALQDDAKLRCLVGRTGRVFFDRRPLDWLRSFWT